MTNFIPFFEKIETCLANDNFVKITLSKPLSKQNELQNAYIRLITLKQKTYFSFTYRYKTNDQVKNYTFEEAKERISVLLTDAFRFATLFTLTEDVQCFVSKKKIVSIKTNQPSFKNKLPEHHDKVKVKSVVKSDYLFHLGISDKEGNIIPKMADKFRQINKYLEIINDLIKSTDLPNTINIVDMGSGKGYLTFALYDFLTNKKGYNVTITGIELRKNLVNYCTEVAQKCKFNNLFFECKSIEDYHTKNIDILIALHACDTATDDALYKALVAKATLIVTAPCCHKQIRQQLKGTALKSPILKYGIFKERQYEMLTDTLRALLLEKENYQTKIFEFISNEHTRKNVMLVAKKSIKKVDKNAIDEKIINLKEEFNVTEHYLEKLMQEKDLV